MSVSHKFYAKSKCHVDVWSWKVRISYAEKTLKTKFGLGISKLFKKKKKPDTPEFNSKERLSIVNKFTPTGYCLSPTVQRHLSLLSFTASWGMGDLSEHPNTEAQVIVRQAEFEQSKHSELGQSWCRLTYMANGSHQHETDHMVTAQGFPAVLFLPFTGKCQLSQVNISEMTMQASIPLWTLSISNELSTKAVIPIPLNQVHL